METLSNEEVLSLIKRGIAFKNNEADFSLDRQYFAANLFFEPSTRTHKSFEVAERKLGLDVIEFDAKTSSVNKGETLYDTILTMSSLGIDICVIRHSMEDYYKELIDSRTIQTAIVNGGDGSGQHPSQCLLDLMTIYEEFGSFENLKVAIVGDITHSRVDGSKNRLAAKYCLSKLKSASLFLNAIPRLIKPSTSSFDKVSIVTKCFSETTPSVIAIFLVLFWKNLIQDNT